MALIGNDRLFAMSFAQHEQFIAQNTVVTGTPEAEMVERVGTRIVEAAQKWFTSVGHPNFMDQYCWEFSLIQDNSINAAAFPGGRIVIFTGILPVTQNEAGLAVVMGHEIAHVILNHGQQRMSAAMLQNAGFMGLAVGLGVGFGGQPNVSVGVWLDLFHLATTLGGTLPFSRRHEIEADRYGLKLMAIAGYDPNEGALFWERMSALGGSSIPPFLSTHPSDATRMRELRNSTARATQVAAEFGVRF